MITDPYLDALTKETKARTRNILTVSTDQDVARYQLCTQTEWAGR